MDGISRMLSVLCTTFAAGSVAMPTTRSDMNQSNESEIYELLGQSPLAWLEQAEFLKMSGVLVLEKLREIRDVPQVRPGIREQKLALTQSFMLLMGLSFENLIKGLHIAQTPGLSIEDRIKIWTSYRGGHGISALIKLATSTNAKEENLLRRLEEYAFWAGRYPIPRNTNQYHSAQKYRTLFPQDPALCDTLFERLASMVRMTASS
jgi:hypothetical protein